MAPTVTISHPEKVLFPDDGITKGDLAAYYDRVAPLLLPHVAGRPLTMHRFPEGIGGKGFYQKDAPTYFPAWIPRVTVPKEGGGTTSYVVCDDAETLRYVVNQNTITPHVWLSPAEQPGEPERPLRLVFDLDPGTAGFGVVRDAARRLHDLLGGLELPVYVKASGSKGLHVEVPLDGSATLEEVRSFATTAARVLIGDDPDHLTLEHRKAKRGDRLYLDLRNGHAQTTVAPYAVRALPTAPVAAPLEWDEVDDETLDPRRWTVTNLFRRLSQRPDPWADLAAAAVPLAPAAERLAAMPAVSALHDDG